ncbi:MAG: HD domain-containing protein [Eubacteriales bacterium]|nr:HD domain-containing protein [Eubacteriales bacterium]
MAEYFTFTAAEKRYLNQVNTDHDSMLSPYATHNADATRAQSYTPRFAIIRPPYSYDVDRIIHSPLYNRYADKTQVFSFYKNDDLTRRALHVQFVSKIARTIGRALRLNLDLIDAISLGHDMGHTPFGHKGETFLSENYQRGTQIRGGQKRFFNHNVHSTRIFRYILSSNLTLQTLSGILAHNGEKVYQEYSPISIASFSEFDQTLEQCYLSNDYHKSLRPNTLEGCVVRISDMIAYAGKDRQDLYKANLITSTEFEKTRLIGTKNSEIISNVVVNLVKNSIESPALNMDAAVFNDLKDLIAENYKVIYQDEHLNEQYFEIIQPLMQLLYEQLINDIQNKNHNSPVFQHYLNDSIQGNVYRDLEKRYITASPDDIVTDFIASMTDDYFIDICRALHLNDTLLDRLRYHEYFDC